MRPRHALAIALGTLLPACVALYDFSGYVTSGADRIGAPTPFEASTPQVPDTGPADCGSVAEDSANCGRCGHDCAGGACARGVCQPQVLVDPVLAPSDVGVDDDWVY